MALTERQKENIRVRLRGVSFETEDERRARALKTGVGVEGFVNPNPPPSPPEIEEPEAAQNKLKAKYPNGALPDWRNVWVQVESIEDCRCGHTPDDHTQNNGVGEGYCRKCDCEKCRKKEKIVALVEFDSRVCVNTLDAESPRAALEIISWADGFLASFPQWEFLLPDANKRMQEALRKHYGLEGEVEVPHRVYLIRRG